MAAFKLIQICNDSVYYKTLHAPDGKAEPKPETVQQAHLYTLADAPLLEHFSLSDQEVIVHSALHDGYSIGVLQTGESILVPNKRLDYLYFFLAVFGLAILMSILTSIRYIHLGNTTVYGNFLFFPLAFACTDIMNELYGYKRVRNVIYSVSLALIVIALLLHITFNVTGVLASGDSDSRFIGLFNSIPLVALLYAFSLLISDSANAYLFHRIKHKLQGQALWLRSIISTFSAHFLYSSILVYIEVVIGIIDIPVSTAIDIVLSGHLVKMLYALCSLPLIYAAVFWVKHKDKEHALTYGRPCPDDLIKPPDAFDAPVYDAPLYGTRTAQIRYPEGENHYYLGFSKTGQPCLFAHRRINYMLFFIALFTLSTLTAIFTSLRFIKIGDVWLYGNFLFFPLIFAANTIITELYGRPRVHIMLYTTSAALVVMAGIFTLTLRLSGTLNDGSSDADFIHLFKPMSRTLVLWAIALLGCNLLNVALLNIIKDRTYGQKLWLRVVVSTFVTQSLFTPLLTALESASGRLHFTLPQIVDIFYADLAIKLSYTLCILPIVYGCIYWVRRTERARIPDEVRCLIHNPC